LETFWLARGTQPLAALTNIGLQLFIGMLAVWIGNLFAHHMGS
jgi:fluoride ion exporter CrcB/FEX